MKTFEIKEEFILNGKPIKLISGAIHYFRMMPSQWEDSLYNLKALGANTVETYIPWNIHEPVEGQFDFKSEKNIFEFIEKAEELGLLVILRPSVYICAEWEFGGMPAWLLNIPNIRLRSTDSRFIEKVENYFSHLLPKLAPYQVTAGGPVIMMQIENEYGSYGMEKEYLRQTKTIMQNCGVSVPLFTADGTWNEVLDSGSMIEDDVFVTGNFGSKSKENTAVLKAFMERHNKKWPLMCMEFWDGWFNRWGEEIIRRDAEDLAHDVKEMLELGSLNLYMFHGGTNFGFNNGCSARGMTDLPQVTSYDYDALLTEDGQPTEKYFAVQRVIKEVCPDVWQAEPRRKTLKALGEFPVANAVGLFNTLDTIAKPIKSTYPLRMEEAGSGYGYMLYKMTLKNYHRENRLRVVEASDRIHVYLNEEKIKIQKQHEIGEDIILEEMAGDNDLEVTILLENQGRVNYGHKLNAPTQSKGIRGGVMYDIHFHQVYEQFTLELDADQLALIDYTQESNHSAPSFYKFTPEITEVADTFIDCSKYGKGVIFVNGFNLGRYWERGPHLSLYCPKDLLKPGKNEIVVFETEGVLIESLQFVEKPVYI
ncbi:glycoside hydrolase family 35 protein [Jeotgalibaca sp. A122]|uniref:glycoside hydrolase family 35 protein n=1 Tax=Jeotgalibaca sp. A122 TaxID=3457322 RepID=UPI003FD2FB49